MLSCWFFGCHDDSFQIFWHKINLNSFRFRYYTFYQVQSYKKKKNLQPLYLNNYPITNKIDFIALKQKNMDTIRYS